MKYILILFFCCSLAGVAQKETYNWYFGTGAGVTFMPDGTSAKFLPDGQFESSLYPDEGTATLSDRNGDLLFYSNGRAVWNKNHEQIKGGFGLFGGQGSARSVVIVPRPSSNRYYYVFTIEAHEDWRVAGQDTTYQYGLRYSIIDAAGDNGNGEILPSQKNILLLENAVEKMVAVNHQNGRDIWLITYNWSNNNYYTYLLTKDSIRLFRAQPRPFPKPNSQFYKTCFNLEYDAKSQRLIDCDVQHGFIIYNFSNGTIVTNNPIVLPAAPPNWDSTGHRYWPYSAAFSADGRKLYATCYSNVLLQFDFSASSAAEIAASRTVIADETTTGITYPNFGAIRRGPDDKLYIARNGATHLAVVEQPNNPAEQCGFVLQGLYLQGAYSGWGLPITLNYTTAPCDFAGAAGGSRNACLGTTIELGNTTFDNGNMSFEWNPKTGLDNPFSINPLLSVTATTQLVLTVTDNVNACSYNDTITITMSNPPTVVAAEDATTCVGQAVTIGRSDWDDSYIYEWTPADGLPNWQTKTVAVAPDSTTEYVVSILDTTTGCYSYDTIVVNVAKLDNFEVDGSLYICAGRPTILSVVDDFVSYVWSTGETTKSITVASAGTLSVTITTASGCSGTRILVVEELSAGSFNIVAPESVCEGTTAELSIDGEFASYVWSTGDVTPSISIASAGQYWVTVTTAEGCIATDTVTIGWGTIDYILSKNDISFGGVCTGSAADIVETVTNTGSSDIIIDSIYISGSGSAFSVDVPTFPAVVVADGLASAMVSFAATEPGAYTDTLVISVSSPCRALLRVPVSAVFGGMELAVTSTEMLAAPGDTIAILAEVGTLEDASIPFNFTIKCSVRWDILTILGIDGGTILSRSKDSVTWIETLLIECSYPAAGAMTLLQLSAFAHVGRDTISPIRWHDFVADAPCLFSSGTEGSVTLTGCALPLRLFDWFEPSELRAKPSVSSVVCSGIGSETGQYWLELYSVTGQLVERYGWAQGACSVSFDYTFSVASAGSYFAVLRGPSGQQLVRPVVVSD